MNLFKVLLSALVFVFMLGLTDNGFADRRPRNGKGLKQGYGWNRQVQNDTTFSRDCKNWGRNCPNGNSECRNYNRTECPNPNKECPNKENCQRNDCRWK